MKKLRNHNEYFMPIKKQSCPCGQRKVDMYAWGEYANGSWRTVDHFCQHCFASRVLDRLMSHTDDCGCVVTLCARNGYTLADWIRLPSTCKLGDSK